MTDRRSPTTRKAAHILGLDAEARAAEYLRKQGYTVLAERLRTLGGEIDVLALEGKDTLVIVEVKARRFIDDGLWSVTPAKRKRLQRAAEAVLMECDKFTGLDDYAALNIRFDVIVIAPNVPPTHLVNAWQVE